MNTIRLFPHLVWFEAKRFQAYPLEAVAAVAERLIQTGLYILFWLVVGRFGEQGGITPRAVIGYYLLVSGLVPFFYTSYGIARDIIRLIKTGELNYLLIRPVNVLVYPWAARTGRGATSYALGVISIIAGLVVSQPEWTAHHALLFPVVIANMLALNVAFNMLVGTLAFYFVEAKGFQSTAEHFSKLLRGELIPLHYMPPQLVAVLQFTPFPATLYHLTGLLQGAYAPTWGQVGIASLWSVALLSLAVLFWRNGLKRYEAVGL